jgi:hypothetical protein
VGALILFLGLSSLGRATTATAVQLQNDNGTPQGYSSSITACYAFGSVLQAEPGQ